MHTNGYHENDCVRVLRGLTGKDPYTQKSVPVSIGQIGTIIVGTPGASHFDVEFVLFGNDGAYSVVAIAKAADLEPYTETATV